jgi:hypothetical protein
MSVTVTLGRARLAIMIERLSRPAGLEPLAEAPSGAVRTATLAGRDSDGRYGGVTAEVLRSMFAASRGRRVPRRSTGA